MRVGLSPRGGLALVRVAKVWAAADGRGHVVPQDVATLCLPVLSHRLILPARGRVRRRPRSTRSSTTSSPRWPRPPAGADGAPTARACRSRAASDRRVPARWPGRPRPAGGSAALAATRLAGRPAATTGPSCSSSPASPRSCSSSGSSSSSSRARCTPSSQLRPARVTVGEPATAQVDVRGSAVRLLPPVIEVPLGDGRGRVVRVAARTVAGAPRRAVRVDDRAADRRAGAWSTSGPATHVRTDPLGLFRRRREVSQVARCCTSARWSRRCRRWRPGSSTTSRASPSDKLAASDLSFHALREYVPGDDPRHIHWRSTARAGALLVRQFQLTRRSHATVLLDPSPRAYADDDEFELAVSVADVGGRCGRWRTTTRSRFGCGDDIVTTARAAGHARPGLPAAPRERRR